MRVRVWGPREAMSGRNLRRRRLAQIGAAVTVALTASVLATTPPAAGQGGGPTEPGAGLAVDITSPADGAATDDGEVTLEGVVRVAGDDTIADTSVVIAIDNSNSTTSSAGVDCTGNGVNDNIFTCEKAAVIDFINGAAEVGTVAEIALIRFAGSAVLLDARPDLPGVQAFTEPDADYNDNGIPDLIELVNAMGRNSGTRYDRPIALACSTMTVASQPNRYVVMLSDGENASGGHVSTVLPCPDLPPVPFYTFAVGTGARCDLGSGGSRGSLQEVADLSGGTCTDVTDPSDLRRLLDELVRPELERVELSVNGGPPVDISGSVTPSLPTLGPVEATFSHLVSGLEGPIDELCVTAIARRGTQVLRRTNCVEVVSGQPPVADAGGDQMVAEGSVVTLDGSGSHDPGGAPLSYRWEVVSASGPPVLLSSATEPAVSFLALDDATYTFELTVDNGRFTDTDRAQVTVTNEVPAAELEVAGGVAGGAVLATGSFTDPGPLDTHTRVCPIVCVNGVA